MFPGGTSQGGSHSRPLPSASLAPGLVLALGILRPALARVSGVKHNRSRCHWIFWLLPPQPAWVLGVPLTCLQWGLEADHTPPAALQCWCHLSPYPSLLRDPRSPCGWGMSAWLSCSTYESIPALRSFVCGTLWVIAVSEFPSAPSHARTTAQRVRWLVSTGPGFGLNSVLGLLSNYPCDLCHSYRPCAWASASPSVQSRANQVTDQ